MPISVVMPALEMAQETGKLIAWRKKEGEAVAKGEILLEIETDKAVMEIEAPGDGVLAGVRAQEGAVVPVGQTIAWIVAPGETAPAIASLSAMARAVSSSTRSAASVPQQTSLPVAADIRISPKARRLAKERGVDISSLRGSGTGGEILAEDILAAAQALPTTGGESLSSVARLMAEGTARSWTTVPHFFVVREVDAGALIAARERLAPAIQATNCVKLSHTDLLTGLVAGVLAKHPGVNASWREQTIQLNSEINVAIAVAVEDGVVAGVIHQANKASLGEIAVQRRDLSERARAGRLRPADIAGATFTISNLGMYDVDAFSAIITPPQAAILAVGRIADRVVPVNGAPGIRPMMTLTLSCDHRVIDGAKAADFLKDLTGVIGKPEEWLS
jgi:pyruvate dehydrogenase E2 component (dihydrolipoamide acetyltransferase)